MNGMRALSNFVGASSAAAMMLSTTLAVAQPITPEVAQDNASAVSQANADDDRKNCKYIRAVKGGGSEIIPPERLKADDAVQFPYLRDDTRLEPENQAGDERRKGCGFFLFGPQFASAGPGAAGGVAAGGAATGAGFGVATGAIAAGAVAVGLGAIAVGVGLGVVSQGGKSNQTNGPVCTTNCNGTPQ